MSFFCRSMGAPIPMLQAHAVARTMCSCKNFSLDPQGDHVITCKKHTGATRGHNHVMYVLVQLACNTGYSVRVNHKVSTTAAASNKQGDVELVNFGLECYKSLVIDVSICCDHIGNSTINNGHLNGKMHTNDYLQARATIKNQPLVQSGLCCCRYGVCPCNCVSGWPNLSRVSLSPMGLG